MFPCTSQFTMTTLYVVECMYHYSMQAKRNMTPLMVAAREGHAQVVELLLSKGAEDNLKNKVRRSTIYCTEPVTTLVFFTQSWKNLTAACCQFILHAWWREGDKVQFINNIGKPCHCLFIKTFLQHHATYSIMTLHSIILCQLLMWYLNSQDGLTAYDLAKRNSYTDITDLLSMV